MTEAIDSEPAAEDVAALVIAMTAEPWPGTEEERQCYFAAVGLQDGELITDAPGVTAWAVVPLSGNVRSIWSTFQGEFLGIDLFVYSEQQARGSRSAAAFPVIKDQLTAAFGDPLEEWGPQDQPAVAWTAGILTVEMYLHQQHDSVIQVGVSHTARSAANDAAHSGREFRP